MTLEGEWHFECPNCGSRDFWTTGYRKVECKVCQTTYRVKDGRLEE